MTSRTSRASRRAPWLGIALAAVLGTAALATAAENSGSQAPAWPNLLSEAGRRAAMALPKSNAWHLDKNLADLEDESMAKTGASLSAKARYDARIAAGLPPQTRANDPTGDQGPAAAETQSELGLAAFGNTVICAWNDSKGLRLGSPTTVTSYGYSCDGGATFTDGGNVPLIAAGNQSFGDCTIDVDASGNYYMAVIYVGATQSIAVYRGTFTGCAFSWGTPVIAAAGAGSLDKCYLCVDPATGDVYVSFTRFSASVSIEVVRGTALGTVWSAPVVLDIGTSGIQGSRPIVGPEGNLYVCWQSGWGFINCDLSNATGTVSFKRSVPASAMTFGPLVTAGTVHMNWLSYWAGNLRANALHFPDMGVDRSGGANNGNVYVVWNEAVPWTSNAASGVSTAETEANDDATSANVKTLNPGDNATGSVGSINDFDYWKLNVTNGQHIQVRLEPQGFNCGVTGTTRNFQLRMFKGTVGTAGDSILGNSNLNGFASEIVFDANETATYLFRVRNVNASGTTTGTYTVKTRTLTYGAPSPARDMRDVVVARSVNQGVSFQSEVRVNNDAVGLDNCIPAITVDKRGCVHAFYYDSRDGLGARILRSYYRSVSSDGGLTWPTNHRISNQLQYFNLNTVAIPNYGEYNQACTVVGNSANLVYASWSDERLANANTTGVDAYVAALNCCVTTNCAADTVVTSGGAAVRRLCITNCGNFDEDYNYSISDTQGWATPSSGSVTVVAGGTTCFNVTVSVPPGTPGGTFTVLTLSASAASCANVSASCTSKVTAEAPVAVAIEDLSASATDNGVSLRWRLTTDAQRELAGVVVERASDARGPYEARGARLSPAPEMAFDDADVQSGQTYWYRLVLESAAGSIQAAGPVQVTVGSRLGMRTALHGAYENAAGSVDIRFSLAHAGAVKLEIYDVMGHRLRTIESGTRPSGEFLRTWDRNTDSGVRVARGVYIVKLDADHSGTTRKMVLVRD